MVDDVSFAGQFWYETEVAFRHEYEEKINGIADGAAEGAAEGVRGPKWAGQPVRAGLESADRQAGKADGGKPDDAAVGRDASRTEKGLKASRACAGFIAPDTPEFKAWFGGSKVVDSKLCKDFGDGSYATPVYRWELNKALSRKEIQAIIDKSGLYGLTFGDNFVEAYHVGDPKNEQARAEFKDAIERAAALLGARAGGTGRSVARLWAYGDVAAGYGDIGYDRIRGYLAAGPATSSATARRVAPTSTPTAISSARSRPRPGRGDHARAGRQPPRRCANHRGDRPVPAVLGQDGCRLL